MSHGDHDTKLIPGHRHIDLLTSGVKVRFSPVQRPLCLNLELDFWFGSGKSLNFEPNLRFRFSSGLKLHRKCSSSWDNGIDAYFGDMYVQQPNIT